MSSRLSSLVVVLVVVVASVIICQNAVAVAFFSALFRSLSKLIVKVATCHCLPCACCVFANFHVLQLATAPQLLDGCLRFLAYFLAVFSRFLRILISKYCLLFVRIHE